MKFGLLTLFDHYPEDCSEAQYYENFFAEVTYAEELGFDSVWIGEHHFDRYICPAPQIVAAAIAQGISFAANMAMWGAMFGGGRNDRDGGNPIGALLLVVLGPLAAGVIQMAISRSREYEADASAARPTV